MRLSEYIEKMRKVQFNKAFYKRTGTYKWLPSNFKSIERNRCEICLSMYFDSNHPFGNSFYSHEVCKGCGLTFKIENEKEIHLKVGNWEYKGLDLSEAHIEFVQRIDEEEKKYKIKRQKYWNKKRSQMKRK